MWLYHGVTSPSDADGMANSVDLRLLLWVCTVCPGIPVRKLRIIMVLAVENSLWQSRLIGYGFLVSKVMILAMGVVNLEWLYHRPDSNPGKSRVCLGQIGILTLNKLLFFLRSLSFWYVPSIKENWIFMTWKLLYRPRKPLKWYKIIV